MGGGLTGALRMRAEASLADSTRSKTACILIWLDGGPSHFETFDPKPEAAVEIRGEFGAIPTKVPGMLFSENMPRLAAIADKLTIVRSIRHDQNNHGAGNHYMMTGAPTRIPVSCGAFVSFHPSMGSVVSAERGAPGIPYFCCPRRPARVPILGPKMRRSWLAMMQQQVLPVRDVTLPGSLDDGRCWLGDNCGRSWTNAALERAANDPVLGVDENYQQALSLMTSQRR